MRTREILTILIVLLVVGSSLSSLIMLGNAQDDDEELVQFFVEYNNKIYYNASDIWNFTITNLNCIPDNNVGKASFFLKIYVDGEPHWNEYTDTVHHTWQLGIGEDTTRSFSFPPWNEAKLHKVKIELYWYGRLKPVAKRTKVVHVAKAFVLDWTPSAQIVSRGAGKPSNLSISFKNGGNDNMYNTSIAVVDADGLEITPQLQNLKTMEPGENKTVIFYVNASQSEERRQVYNPRFETIYYDFRGIVHQEEYTATVRVIANPFIHSLVRTLGAIAITTAIGAALIFVGLAKKSKRRSFMDWLRASHLKSISTILRTDNVFQNEHSKASKTFFSDSPTLSAISKRAQLLKVLTNQSSRRFLLKNNMGEYSTL